MTLVFRGSEKKETTFDKLPVDSFFVIEPAYFTLYKKLDLDNYLKITMNPFNVFVLKNGTVGFGNLLLEEIELCEATIYAKYLYRKGT